MGKDLNRYLSKEANWSQAQEKMLNIISHQRDANRNHAKMPLGPCGDSYTQNDNSKNW